MTRKQEAPFLKAEKAPKAKKQAEEKPIEVILWDAANKLRGGVEPGEYKHVVLSLIFLKFAADKFEAQRAKLIADKKEKYLEMPEFYNKDNVFFLDEKSRWNYLIKKSKQDDLALIIDTALHTVEKNNKALKGALPDNYFSRLGLDSTKLASLLDTINNIDTLKDHKQDLVGRVYEYFLSKFALAEGKGKGEFYTPKTIVNLIAEMIEPYKGKIYDPCCGSGGMFVQSLQFIESHKGNKRDVSVYGQEQTVTTYKLAKMNLAIRSIAGNLGEKAANTFSDDQHKDLKADYIMANPPFNQKDWRAENELTDDPRWQGYEVPPTSNANYAWILHMASKLSESGVAGFILANGALSARGNEKNIRETLIRKGLIEAIIVLPMDMFYTTDISVSLWILNKNKKRHAVTRDSRKMIYRERTNEILFIDARNFGTVFDKKYIEFSIENDISKIARIYHSWQLEKPDVPYQNQTELCYSASLAELEGKDFSLVPSNYIKFKKDETFVHYEENFERLKTSVLTQLKDDSNLNKKLLNLIGEN